MSSSVSKSSTKPKSKTASAATSSAGKKPAKVAAAAKTAGKPVDPPSPAETVPATDGTVTVPEKKERKRRLISKESVDADFTLLSGRIEAEIARLKESEGKQKGVKLLSSLKKAVKTLHSDVTRVMKLKKKNNRKKNVVSGFLKPIRMSAELSAFCGRDPNEEVSRVVITKYICEYIKTHELQNPSDRRLIECDKPLQDLLKYDPENPGVDEAGNPAPLNYFRLQKYLKPHFIKIETAKDASSGSSAAKKTKAKASSAGKTKTPAKKAPAPTPAEVDVEEEDIDDTN